MTQNPAWCLSPTAEQVKQAVWFDPDRSFGSCDRPRRSQCRTNQPASVRGPRHRGQNTTERSNSGDLGGMLDVFMPSRVSHKSRGEVYMSMSFFLCKIFSQLWSSYLLSVPVLRKRPHKSIFYHNKSCLATLSLPSCWRQLPWHSRVFPIALQTLDCANVHITSRSPTRQRSLSLALLLKM